MVVHFRNVCELGVAEQRWCHSKRTKLPQHDGACRWHGGPLRRLRRQCALERRVHTDRVGDQCSVGVAERRGCDSQRAIWPQHDGAGRWHSGPLRRERWWCAPQRRVHTDRVGDQCSVGVAEQRWCHAKRTKVPQHDDACRWHGDPLRRRRWCVPQRRVHTNCVGDPCNVGVAEQRWCHSQRTKEPQHDGAGRWHGGPLRRLRWCVPQRRLRADRIGDQCNVGVAEWRGCHSKRTICPQHDGADRWHSGPLRRLRWCVVERRVHTNCVGDPCNVGVAEQRWCHSQRTKLPQHDGACRWHGGPLRRLKWSVP